MSQVLMNGPSPLSHTERELILAFAPQAWSYGQRAAGHFTPAPTEERARSTGLPVGR